MKTATTDLINAVDQERSKMALTDRQFSLHVLGISPSYWCLLKSGQRPPTLALLRTIMQKLPNLAPEVTIYIMRQGNDGQGEQILEKRHDETAPSEEILAPTPKTARKPSKNVQGGRN